jgi:hypothetical protein
MQTFQAMAEHMIAGILKSLRIQRFTTQRAHSRKIGTDVDHYRVHTFTRPSSLRLRRQLIIERSRFQPTYKLFGFRWTILITVDRIKEADPHFGVEKFVTAPFLNRARGLELVKPSFKG